MEFEKGRGKISGKKIIRIQEEDDVREGKRALWETTTYDPQRTILEIWIRRKKRRFKTRRSKSIRVKTNLEKTALTMHRTILSLDDQIVHFNAQTPDFIGPSSTRS